jgi:hypothetical protein
MPSVSWLTFRSARLSSRQHYGEGIYAIVREREPELRELVRKVVLAYAREAVADLGGADNSVKVAIGDYNG